MPWNYASMGVLQRGLAAEELDLTGTNPDPPPISPTQAPCRSSNILRPETSPPINDQPEPITQTIPWSGSLEQRADQRARLSSSSELLPPSDTSQPSAIPVAAGASH